MLFVKWDTTENRLEHSELGICWEIRDQRVPHMIVARLLAVCLLRCALQGGESVPIKFKQKVGTGVDVVSEDVCWVHILSFCNLKWFNVLSYFNLLTVINVVKSSTHISPNHLTTDPSDAIYTQVKDSTSWPLWNLLTGSSSWPLYGNCVPVCVKA